MANRVSLSVAYMSTERLAKHSMCQVVVFWRTPRLHILVKTEKVGGIVFCLEFDQSLIIATECRPNCIRAFVPKKIHEARYGSSTV
jgi:phosphoribosyl-AMP cyclohydrolase